MNVGTLFYNLFQIFQFNFKLSFKYRQTNYYFILFSLLYSFPVKTRPERITKRSKAVEVFSSFTSNLLNTNSSISDQRPSSSQSSLNNSPNTDHWSNNHQIESFNLSGAKRFLSFHQTIGIFVVCLKYLVCFCIRMMIRKFLWNAKLTFSICCLF